MLDRLKDYLYKLSGDGIAVAFSGGTDSTLLLAVLSELHRESPFPAVALTMQTILQNAAEITEAQALAKKFGIEHKIFSFNPFSLDEVRNNRIDRCYHCKKAIFKQFADYTTTHGFKYLLDGTNADDLNVYRPGRKALHELGVISPLAELGLSKPQIRQMSAALNLETAFKPAIPCMATRFEYDTLLSDEMVERVTAGEIFIKKAFPKIDNFRLRVHDHLVRLEVCAEMLPQIITNRKFITEQLKNLGFEYITLDLEGFRSGSFDNNLK